MKRTHGQSSRNKTRSYRIWGNMLTRCLNERNPSYQKYGAIGISVCDRWRDFQFFFKDMGHPPESMTLDRIDGSKGYFKENCRWATYTEQNRNRKDNVRYTIDGHTKIAAEWFSEFGIKHTTFYQRLKRGWDVATALKTPTGCYVRG